jgi:hypothetical protein
LAELRGCVEYAKGEKERILPEIEALRAERR